MAAVTLYVADFEAMISYYRDALRLTLQSRSTQVATLGRSGVPIITLRHEPQLPLPSRAEAGLFHTALLFGTEASLAATVASAAQHRASRYVGSADHLVSKAFYFTDPESNGIELYWDRPRSSWTFRDGRVEMDSLFLDPNDYLATHLDDSTQLAAPASVGHVHLQVGDTQLARKFYVDTLGFETTAAWNGALFVSAGGYHHHMAMNTWNSAGAGPRAATLGLGEVSITVPSRSDIEAVMERLRHSNIQIRDDGAGISFDDPWRNLITINSAHPA
ncbi:VOC family protein [Saxibacter everestensis]|uniref:VOC family protein n=1 Tax=Saxibacter everestensis TaxID=2909229 RepID=A0ABY8QYF8_9MICO|nr:VOC family protein [Brevibacteriaceae bacterium ZFBP1038]